MFFNHNDVMLLHIMGVSIRFTSLFLYLDIVLSLVITLSLFSHNDGWLLHTRILSCGGYAFFQVHKNLKWIYLTFGYVGVAHWQQLMDGFSAGRGLPRRKR